MIRELAPFCDLEHRVQSGDGGDERARLLRIIRDFQLLRLADAREVRWMRQTCDPGRFGLTPIKEGMVRADVVMIGSRYG